MSHQEKTSPQAGEPIRAPRHFPGFDGNWVRKELRPYLGRHLERVPADTDLRIYSSSREGLLPQDEYYGGHNRINDGEYGVVPEGHFVYRHMSDDTTFKFNINNTGQPIAVSKEYPVFTTDGVDSTFLRYLLNESYPFKQFAAMQRKGGTRTRLYFEALCSWRAPLPSLPEQERIAECLVSIDALIEAETEKLDALKDHKQGLMQQLFPAEGEDLPKRRFPEFANEGAWEETRIDQLCKPFSGGTPPTSRDEYYGGEIPFIRSAEIALERTELFLTPEGLTNSAAKLVAPGDVLIALYGANSGEVAVSKIAGAINQAIICLQVGPDSEFVAQYWSHLKQWIVNTYIQGGQGNISGEIVKSIELKMPRNPSERLKVSKVLMAADNLMESQENRIERLRLRKLGLLQQLFPVLDGVDG